MTEPVLLPNDVVKVPCLAPPRSWKAGGGRPYSWRSLDSG